MAHPYPNILTNLTSWWSLNEASGTRIDSHGANHGTDSGSVGVAAGKVGNAADVPGGGHNISIADHASVRLNGADFTIAGWVKLDGLPSNGYLVSKGNAPYEYSIDYYSVPNRFRFWTYNGTQNLVTANNLGAPSAGVWYFIVCWYDLDADTWNIQVNNGTPDSAAGAYAATNSSATIRLGASPDLSANIDGLLDEWAIWKGYNLSAAERTWLYNAGAGRSYAELSEVASVGAAGVYVAGGGASVVVLAAAGLWSPASLASLTAWWDFSDATKLFTDAGSTPVSADGQMIGQANDKSGIANWHLSKHVSWNSGVYKTGIINGLSVARFTNPSVMLKAGISFSLVEHTILVVMQQTGAGDNGGVLLFYPTSGDDYQQTDAIPYNMTDASGLFGVTASTGFSLDVKISGTGLAPLAVWGARKTAGTLTLYQNGAAATAVDSSFTELSTCTGGILLGCRYVGNSLSFNGFTGDIGEVIVCSAQLSVSDFNLAGAYLAAKWGLTWATI